MKINAHCQGACLSNNSSDPGRLRLSSCRRMFLKKKMNQKLFGFLNQKKEGAGPYWLLWSCGNVRNTGRVLGILGKCNVQFKNRRTLQQTTAQNLLHETMYKEIQLQLRTERNLSQAVIWAMDGLLGKVFHRCGGQWHSRGAKVADITDPPVDSSLQAPYQLGRSSLPRTSINFSMDDIVGFIKNQFDPKRSIIIESYKSWSDMKREPGNFSRTSASAKAPLCVISFRSRIRKTKPSAHGSSVQWAVRRFWKPCSKWKTMNPTLRRQWISRLKQKMPQG